MRVLFWGTPEFAVPSLRALLGEGFDVVGVVTQPDKAQGRSRSRLVPSPIKALAKKERLPLFQPEDPRTPAFLQELAAIAPAPDLSAVVAYGHILTRPVLDLPARGTFNVHASLLPTLRGAAPIQAAIRQGMTETGVTVMRIVPALDAGPIVLQLTTPIAPDETYGELQLRLSELGAEALIEALTLMEAGAAGEQPQDDALATYARKIDREETRIVWDRPAAEVARTIRAYDPKPGAFTVARSAEVKCFGAEIVTDPTDGPAGTVVSAGPGGLVVACAPGAVRIEEVQPSGRGRMLAEAWARGRGASIGDRLG